MRTQRRSDEAPDLSIDAARELALRMLTARSCTKAQISARLTERGFPHAVIDELIERFETVGLVDDRAYADAMVRTRRLERGLSRRAISMELSRKGVADGDAMAALDQYPRDQEEAVAVAQAHRRLRRMGPDTPPDVRRRRLYAALGRKGFEPAIAARAVDIALAEDDGAPNSMPDA